MPCVIYGGKEQLHFITPAISFKDIVYTPDACLVLLEIDGKQYNAVLQDIQFHPVSDIILHADFLEIFPDKPVKISVPIKIKGNSPGVIKGGKLHTKLRKLRIQGLPDELPDFIDVDISKLEIGDSVKVEELDVDKVTFLDPEHAVVVMVKSTRTAALGEDEEEDEDAEGAEGAEGGESAAGETPAESAS